MTEAGRVLDGVAPSPGVIPSVLVAGLIMVEAALSITLLGVRLKEKALVSFLVLFFAALEQVIAGYQLSSFTSVKSQINRWDGRLEAQF